MIRLHRRQGCENAIGLHRIAESKQLWGVRIGQQSTQSYEKQVGFQKYKKKNVGKSAEMDMHIKQMNQLPCADRKPYNYINKCAPDRPPLGGFMLHVPWP